MTDFPLQPEGTVKLLRYHPVPPGKNPLSASPDVVKFWLMLKSCGRVTASQEPSLKEVLSAPEGSERENFHPSLKRVLLSEPSPERAISSSCVKVVPEVAAYPYAPGIAGTHRATDSITAINCFILFFIELSFE